jgi:alpha-L-rhamnosidase
MNERLFPRTMMVFLCVSMLIGMLFGSFSPPVSAASRADSYPWPANPNWQQYVQAPASRIVLPVKVIDVIGNVTNPQALAQLGSHQATVMTRTREGLNDAGPDSWPVGTATTASSYHACCASESGDSFVPGNAIDGDMVSYWNDANAGSTDSWLEVSTPTPVTLPGLTLLFNSNGVPVDFQIQTWNDSTAQWVTQVSITGNSALEVARLFPAPVTTQHVRIFVTLNQNIGHGQYTRISEVYPYYSPPTSLVLDYGKDVGGVPEFDVAAASGKPQLEAGYSETLQFLSPTGDGGDPFGSGDPHSYDVYTVTQPGTIVNRFVQGGERYEELSLLVPGSITLKSAYIYYEPFLGTSNTFKGNFVSSDESLNRIWYDGAYTLNLVQMRPNTPGGYWVIQNGALNAQGGDAGILNTGLNWTDYTMSFQTKIDNFQSGWVVRAQSPTTHYLLILNASNDQSGTPNALQELVQQAGSYTKIADVPLPFTVNPGTWYNIQISTSGTKVTTAINGQTVASFDSNSFPANLTALSSGTVGFREYSPESADFKNLVVTASNGAVLYQNALSQPASLNGWDAPGVNALPVILDGAKRDRAVWEGDLNVSGPSLYYSSDATEYMKGSLQLLGSYQLQSGFVEGDQVAGAPVSTSGLLPGTVGPYSASYSMYWVTNLADYYLYTADRNFVLQEWPIVARELAWNAAQVDSQGLFVTDGSDGANWHYDTQTGEQTYENVLYYHTLLDAAFLADAAGHSDMAATYRTQAAALKTAINKYLFNAQTGAYDISTTQRGYISQDANAYAVLYGIAPTDKVASILTAMKSLWTTHGALDVSSPAPSGYNQLIGPFMSSYDLWARFQSGDTTDAFQLLATEWGQMLRGDSQSTIWEYMHADGSLEGRISMAHGWSTGPTSALSEYVLGILPIAPGYQSWLVEPHPGTLAWTEGQAPTPYGQLVVKWGQETSNQKFVMQVQAPHGTSGTIAIPTSGHQVRILVNNQLVWNNGVFHPIAGITSASADGQYVTLKGVAAGNYLIVSTQTGSSS